MSDPDSGATVAVVIVNYRTQSLTAAAVRSVLDETDVLQVVVVDNASGDSSATFLQQTFADTRVKVVTAARNMGFGAGVNLGVSALDPDAEFLLLLNSDAELQPGGVDTLIATISADASLAAVAPTILDGNGQLQVDAWGTFPTPWAMVSRANRHPSDADRPDWLSGVALLLRRVAFDAVGGFDARYFMYFEDVDLCRRLRAGGWDLRRCRTANVRHQGGSSFGADVQRDRWYHQSLVRYLHSAGYGSASIAGLAGAQGLWRWLQRRRTRVRRAQRHSGAPAQIVAADIATPASGTTTPQQ